MSKPEIKIKIVETLLSINEIDWDACAAPEEADGKRPFDPFTTYRFLRTLEESGSVGKSTGWHPYYILALRGNDLLGCAPMYVKTHSQGEYIFDHAWANAYERAGGRYYPKVQVAVPFTPVPGKRLLAKKENQELVFPILVEGIKSFVAKNNLSSVHITFCSLEEFERGGGLGLLKRTSSQFHWKNDNYKNFQDFLDALSSRKRKNIRKERKKIDQSNISFSIKDKTNLASDDWKIFYEFYKNTYLERMQAPYLNYNFFELIHKNRQVLQPVVFFAEIDGNKVAGSLCFQGKDILYGRHWGASKMIDSLHFECCYYQGIEYCINNNIKFFDPGVQGEHKIRRGFEPRLSNSYHYIVKEDFRNAIDSFCKEEYRSIEQYLTACDEYTPIKKEYRI